MITAICSFPLRGDLTPEEAIEEIKETIPVYKTRPGLIRKYVCVDLEAGRGCGVYLWKTREDADTYFEVAKPMIKEQIGAEPEVAFFYTPVIVDNQSDEVLVNGQKIEVAA